MNDSLLIHLSALAAAGFILYRYTLQYDGYLREEWEVRLLLARRKEERRRRRLQAAMAKAAARTPSQFASGG